MRNIIITLMVVLFLSSFCLSQDKEAEGRKLYLEASSLIRNEKYKDAKEILEIILSDYIETEIALKADEKYNEILKMIKAASLPKVPGSYIKKKSGELIKIEKESINSAQMGPDGVTEMTLREMLGAPLVEFLLFSKYTEIAADEIESFIIFNPNQTQTAEIKWQHVKSSKVGQAPRIKPKGETLPGKEKTWYILTDEWLDITTTGATIKSGELFKSKISEGMYEIKYPLEYIPQGNRFFALTDGSGEAFPFMLTPTKLTILKTKYLNVWNTGKSGIDEAIQAVKEHPDNIELYRLLSILHYRRNEFQEAESVANKGLLLTESMENYDTSNFDKIIAYSNAAIIVNSNLPELHADEQKLALKITSLSEALKINPNSHQANIALAQVYLGLKDFDESIEKGNEALRLVKELNNPTLFDATLEQYSKNTLKTYNKFVGHVSSEKLLKEIREIYIDGNGNAKQGLKTCDKAKKFDTNNPNVYDVKAQVYQKMGDIKKAIKQAKTALKKAKKLKMEDISYYEGQLSKYEQMLKKK